MAGGFFGQLAFGEYSGETGLAIDLALVEIEVELPAWSVEIPINIDLAPIEIEVELPEFTITGTDIEIALEPVEVEVELPAWAVAFAIAIALEPVEVEVSLPDWIVRIDPDVDAELPAGPRRAFADIFRTDGTLVAPLVPVLTFETHRGVNRVGSWSLTLPVDSPLVSSTPLTKLIQRGWKINLQQEGTHPYDRADLDYLCYQGKVEDKSYQLDNSGTAVCKLDGSFRAIDLASKVTPTAAEYEFEEMGAVVADIEGGIAGGITAPVNSTRRISIKFNNPDGDGIISLLSRLLKVGEMARWFLRETWDQDKPEFIAIDAAPNSGYTMLRQEQAGYGRSPGVAIIGGTPSLRREGRGIANRIIPIGQDTIRVLDQQTETTLQLAEHRYGVEPLDPPGIRLETNPTAGETLEVGDVTYTFVSGEADAEGEISLDGEVRDNIVAAINGTDGVNEPNPTVLADERGFLVDFLRLYFRYSGPPVPFEGIFTGGVFEGGGSFQDEHAGNEFEPGDIGAASATINVPLTLQWATESFPYEVQTGTNPDGSHYYYLEDTESVELYGPVDLPIHRSDIKNPSDDAGTRAAAANVLYRVAWGELLKNKAPKVFVDVPIANGYDVWALPGDRIRLQFSGYVIVNAEVEIWEDIDDWFLVVERVDRSTPSGAREVSLTLAAPEIAIDIPGLPEALGLPEDQPSSEPGGGAGEDGYEAYGYESYTGFPAGNVSLPIPTPDPFDTLPPSLDWVPPGFTGNGGGALFPNCCDDRTTTTTALPPETTGGGSSPISAGWRAGGGGLSSYPDVPEPLTIPLSTSFEAFGRPYALVAVWQGNQDGPPDTPTIAGGLSWEILADVPFTTLRFTLFGAANATDADSDAFTVSSGGPVNLYDYTVVGVNAAAIAQLSVQTDTGLGLLDIEDSLAVEHTALIVLFRAKGISEYGVEPVPVPAADFQLITREFFWQLGGLFVDNVAPHFIPFHASASVAMALGTTEGSTSQGWEWSSDSTSGAGIVVLDLLPVEA